MPANRFDSARSTNEHMSNDDLVTTAQFTQGRPALAYTTQTREMTRHIARTYAACRARDSSRTVGVQTVEIKKTMCQRQGLHHARIFIASLMFSGADK